MKKTLALTLALACSMALMAKGREVVISFDYTRQNGPGSNQYAVWIEDSKGEVVKTLFVTSFTSKGRSRGGEPAKRGYTFRPSCVPTWVQHAKAEKMSDTEVDAVTGATPKADGTQTFAWDFTNQQGKKVASGTYKVFVEATLINNSIITYQGEVKTSAKAGKIALTSTLTEPNDTHAGMIRNVKAEVK